MSQSIQIPAEPPSTRVVIEPGESTTEALFRAAKRAGVDLSAVDTPLERAVDGDAIDRLFERDDRPEPAARLTVTLSLWDHLFVLRPAEITVYEPPY